MWLWAPMRAWLGGILQRERMEREMDAELRFHLEANAEDLVRRGVVHKEAWRRARIEFGGVESTKEECREAKRVSFMDRLMQDSRFAVRTLRKSPGFAAIAVLTLALGIGVNSAVFSVVNAILLKPLPFPGAERIVLPSLLAPPGVNLGTEYIPWSQKQFRQMTRDQHPFQFAGAFQNDSFNLTGAGTPLYLDGYRVTSEFFPALGIPAVIGRTFTGEEDQPGHEHVVVLSHSLWQERFGGDPLVIGRGLNLNGAVYTVLGVMPAGFSFPRAEEMPVSFNFPREAQLWVPLAIAGEGTGGPSELAVIARLKPGISVTQAQAAMKLISEHAVAKEPGWRGWFNTHIVLLDRQVVGDTGRPLLLLLAAVGVVMLVACSNVANLLLSRSLARRKEFALRAGLGAGRSRLIAQLLTESLLLAGVSGVLGIALAEAGIFFVRVLGPPSLPRLREVSLDWRVLLFVAAVALAAGVLFGLLPAFGAGLERLAETLKEAGQRAGENIRSARVRDGLVVSQMALALVLVVASALLVRTFLDVLSLDGGFRPERVLTFQLSLPSPKYSNANVAPLFGEVLRRLREVPGVASAGIAESVPMGGDGESTVIHIMDKLTANPKELPFANYTVVSPGYFVTVGTPLLRGRDFQETDTEESPSVTVINTTMAKKYWPGEDAIGKQVGLGGPKYPVSTVIGIVPDVKHSSLREETAPEMWVLYNQKPWPSMLNMRVAVRTQSDPVGIVSGIRGAIQSIDPDLPLAKVATLATLVDQSLTQQRFAMLMLCGFGALTLLLACIGLYGVIAYSVTQRTREIGIRVALGANRHTIFRMVLGEGVRITALGVGIGVVAALLLTRLIAGLLYGVSASDPLTFAGMALLLCAVAMLACYLPARRATRVDPMVALRHE